MQSWFSRCLILKSSTLVNSVQLSSHKLIIVMASYNGARFIEEQIKSIQGQTVVDWSLIIRDDGSCDGTVETILRLTAKDHRITLLQDGFGNLGVVQNFARLMQIALDSDAGYVAISDQDDIWHREKLQSLLLEMKKIESGDSASTPVLIHSDLEVVDDSMRVIAHSFMDYAKIFPEPVKLGHLLCQNDMTGCACLLNRALLKLALPVPHGLPMHDWWLALLAASAGKIAYVNRALVQYRQHAGNVVGAKSGLARIVTYSLKPERWRQQIENVFSSIRQARMLIERLRIRDAATRNKKNLEVIDAYAKLPNVSRLQRLQVIRAYKIHKRSVMPDALFLLVILSMSSSFVSEQ